MLRRLAVVLAVGAFLSVPAASGAPADQPVADVAAPEGCRADRHMPGDEADYLP